MQLNGKMQLADVDSDVHALITNVDVRNECYLKQLITRCRIHKRMILDINVHVRTENVNDTFPSATYLMIHDYRDYRGKKNEY